MKVKVYICPDLGSLFQVLKTEKKKKGQKNMFWFSRLLKTVGWLEPKEQVVSQQTHVDEFSC